MENTQVSEKVQTQSVPAPVQSASSKSRFNDAEYERWSAKLKNRNSSKGK
jgi:hypothetical protein